MSDYEPDNPKESKKENFADLFESYDSGMSDNLQVGEKIEGEILSIGQDTVFINTGTKTDGAVVKKELLDENGNFPYKTGDLLELYVVSANESEIILSKAISGAGNLNLLQDAYQDHIPVDGKVTGSCKGGFHVEIMKKRAFCPISQMDIAYVEEQEQYFDKTYHFLITKFKEGGRDIVVSRRKLLERDIEESRKVFLKDLAPESILEGKVIKLMPYGAFVELSPGVEGMVHISELSWSRVEKPDDLLKENDIISVKILSIESRDDKKGPKISLSLKQTLGDPWENITEKFHAGDKITGKVTRCADFGAFVEIAPGVEGLIHISEMSFIKRILNPEEIVTAGETVVVTVQQVDEKNKRISLSLKDAAGDPWFDIEKKYHKGKPVEGILEKKEGFGYFIELEPGVTGLLPKSNISLSSDPSVIEKTKIGEKLIVVIENINKEERKISLTAGDAADSDEWKKYSKKKSTSMGSLGDMLQQALDAKNKK